MTAGLTVDWSSGSGAAIQGTPGGPVPRPDRYRPGDPRPARRGGRDGAVCASVSRTWAMAMLVLGEVSVIAPVGRCCVSLSASTAATGPVTLARSPRPPTAALRSSGSAARARSSSGRDSRKGRRRAAHKERPGTPPALNQQPPTKPPPARTPAYRPRPNPFLLRRHPVPGRGHHGRRLPPGGVRGLSPS